MALMCKFLFSSLSKNFHSRCDEKYEKHHLNYVSLKNPNIISDSSIAFSLCLCHLLVQIIPNIICTFLTDMVFLPCQICFCIDIKQLAAFTYNILYCSFFTQAAFDILLILVIDVIGCCYQ